MPLPKFLNDKGKIQKVILVIGTVYGYSWSFAKIIIGILTGAYLYCLSGLSTFFTGLNRHIYLKSEGAKRKAVPAYLISFFLFAIGLFFLLYAMRLFFIESEQREYPRILAITIALFSFIEVGLSIYQFANHRKSTDMSVIAFRTMNLALSVFALVNTQNALFMAQGHVNDFANGLFGVIAGAIAMLLGIALITKMVMMRKNGKINDGKE